MLRRNVGKAAGDIRPADEDNTLDFRADCCQRGADIVAAIEESRKPRLGNGLARRRDERPKPARPHIATRSRRADKHHLAPGSRGSGQSGDRLSE